MPPKIYIELSEKDKASKKRIIDALGRNKENDFERTQAGFKINGHNYPIKEIGLLFSAAKEAVDHHFTDLDAVKNEFTVQIQAGIDRLVVLGETKAAEDAASGLQGLTELLYQRVSD